jgi:hypothetical protein
VDKERATLARSSNPSQLSNEAVGENVQYEVEDDGMPANIPQSYEASEECSVIRHLSLQLRFFKIIFN